MNSSIGEGQFESFGRIAIKRFAGTAGVSPAMSAKRENGSSKRLAEELRACSAFAGETPAVPANRLIGLRPAYAPFPVCEESGYYSRFTNGSKLLSMWPSQRLEHA
jgi:hypothetical protein